MEKIYFTLEDANALLPYLKETMLELQAIKKEIVEIVQNLEEQGSNFEELFSRTDLTESEKQFRGKLEELGDQINSFTFDIQEKGPVVKDIEQGLADFYTKIEDKDAFLCWQLGEQEIQYWHGIQDGFPGRQSLFTREILEDVTKVH